MSQDCTPTDEDVCWICMNAEGDLEYPCHCPRASHRQCLARWQLQNAGTGQEKLCRFCSRLLPDWRNSYALPTLSSKPIAPVMAVVYNDQVYKIPVRPGVDGIAEFKARVKLLFGFPKDVDFEVTFECRTPVNPMSGGGGDRLLMKGLHCFDSAAHCAAHAAAARLARQEVGIPTELTA